MTIKLKRCPFCGSENIKIEKYQKDGLKIKCCNCVVKIEQRAKTKTLDWLESKLIEQWNTRI
jgi:transcription elongation factor Elf1